MADDRDGRGPWVVVQRAAVAVVTVPVKVGLIVLGAGVMAGRSFLGLTGASPESRPLRRSGRKTPSP
jgi:hypothetical protein